MERPHITEDTSSIQETKPSSSCSSKRKPCGNRLNEDVLAQAQMSSPHVRRQATRGARRLIQRLNNELKLPVYVLVDNDPWGLYIYSVVKQGSISLAYESMRMACPKARYLGFARATSRRSSYPTR